MILKVGLVLQRHASVLACLRLEACDERWYQRADFADLVAAAEDEICDNASLFGSDPSSLSGLSNHELLIHLLYYSAAGVRPLVTAVLQVMRSRRRSLEVLLRRLVADGYRDYLDRLVEPVRFEPPLPRKYHHRPHPPCAPMAPPLQA
ncbi:MULTISPECIES: hypothetical protein [Deinococcus]|uniref:Uncharacterized protein n=1 Tax=Deinococcus rufus TaxID=2136097 RepID=A0ABV7Z7E8_9DEIO|nr:hypothetical protein [Deinococcus sp. AB2017081]WQE94677.1 hypothetical protein U2P90_14875 [Deinococcus sp. AB2017081]